jgi:adenylosuccinate synthase
MNKAYIVAGLGFGDEGKGQITNALCRIHNVKQIIRYNGGPQAGHNIVMPDGRHHCFSQFGAGTFDPSVRTYLSKYMMVEPNSMLTEAKELADKGVPWALENITIDPECLVITPWHWLLNQAREVSRGKNRHGSCGFGVGEARAMAEKGIGLRVGAIARSAVPMLAEIKMYAKSEMSDLILAAKDESTLTLRSYAKSIDDSDLFVVNDVLQNWLTKIKVSKLQKSATDTGVLMEGAQGVLLDEDYGFAPHNTWTKTTFDNGLEIAKELELSPVKIGVLRTYLTRHGAGPFPTESSKYAYPDHNKQGDFQGNFRQGAFDFILANYAIRACNGIDELALTHTDRIPDQWEYAYSYSKFDTTEQIWNSAKFNKVKPLYETTPKESVLAQINNWLWLQHKAKFGYISAGNTVEDVKENRA